LYRRIGVAGIFLSVTIIAIFLWWILGSGSTVEVSIREIVALIASTLLLGVSISTLFWSSEKAMFPIAFTIFTVALALISYLVIDSGSVSSPFLILLPLTLLFSSIFGMGGIIAGLLSISVIITAQYINSGLDYSSIAMLAMATALPFAISPFLWRIVDDKQEVKTVDRITQSIATELSEVADKSEVVINAIGDGVVAINSQGVLQLINPAAQEIMGWGKQDALALNYKSVLQLVDNKNQPLDPQRDPIAQALNTNQEVRTSDLTLKTKSGKKLQISLVASPVGATGSGIIVVFRDVTKEKAEEREQAEFISTASHEMRTPVASIEGYLGLALNPATSQIDDKAREFITKAQDAAKHLGRLFQDLLDVSRADDNRINSVPKVVDMITYTKDIVQGLSAKAAEKNLRLTYKPIPSDDAKVIVPSYMVNLDNDHIREVLNNLIENAIKYTPQGEVIVDVTGDDAHVVVSIKDTGIGIPAEDLKHLFQKFYRVENPETNAIGGTGLGLYLSRRLAESMGGRIWAESIYGQGSTFHLELPRISSQKAAELQAQQTSQMTIAPPESPQAVSAEPSLPPVVTPRPEIPQTQKQTPPAPQPATAAPGQQAQSTDPNYSVPRGEVLSAEQKAAYVAKLQAAAAGQSAGTPPPDGGESNSV
jgi:PAS domain S-box-containing protein